MREASQSLEPPGLTTRHLATRVFVLFPQERHAVLADPNFFERSPPTLGRWDHASPVRDSRHCARRASDDHMLP